MMNGDAVIKIEIERDKLLISHNPKGFHKCPVEKCNRKVPNERAFCKQHWFCLSKQNRDKIWSSYSAGNAGTVGHILLLKIAAEEIVNP